MLKDPNADLDYSVDWSAWLVGADTIASSSWEIVARPGAPASAALAFTTGGSAGTNDGTSATAWVGAGAVGERYWLTNRIVTTAGRTDDRSIEITVEQR